MDTLIEKFADLFAGNEFRYGTEEGGSVESKYEWDQLVEWHLTGFIDPIGAYPIDPDTNECQWGCVDFDEGDEESWIHALNLTRYLSFEGVEGWIERSRSKGYHVWVFSREWVPARVMRRGLLYACEFMGAPMKEINPKQMDLAPGEIGNYVRLPYPGALRDSDGESVPEAGSPRVMVMGNGVELSLFDFVEFAWDLRTPRANLNALADRYKPAPKIKHKTYVMTEADIEENVDWLTERLSRDARRLYDKGPRNADRSSTLCALAGCIARDRTHEPDEARALLTEADQRWGKYHTRHDTDIRLDEIIDRAFTDLERSW